MPAPHPVPAVQSGPHWRCVDLLSDLHLQAQDAATFAAWRRYLQDTPADAVFILGDLFEAWVGDDAAESPGFAADCAQVLREAGARRPLYFLHGNRDFLVGQRLAHDCGFTLMQDPCVLAFGARRWLLTHGDALCLSDTAYLAFRRQVRDPAWIAAFLARPLAEREALARQMRQASEARHQAGGYEADVDDAMARQWLQDAGGAVMVHGHTHRPAEHDLGGGRLRIVLCDWDARAAPPRQEVLRISAQGAFERIALPA
ncbi:MAG: putative UDP-2,3-diacylglucosamine hydrolase [Pseudomonadota bacterium]|jgi:UDP-2,3-diacylglucosamine hydrolase